MEHLYFIWQNLPRIYLTGHMCARAHTHPYLSPPLLLSFLSLDASPMALTLTPGILLPWGFVLVVSCLEISFLGYCYHSLPHFLQNCLHLLRKIFLATLSKTQSLPNSYLPSALWFFHYSYHFLIYSIFYSFILYVSSLRGGIFVYCSLCCISNS